MKPLHKVGHRVICILDALPKAVLFLLKLKSPSDIAFVTSINGVCVSIVTLWHAGVFACPSCLGLGIDTDKMKFAAVCIGSAVSQYWDGMHPSLRIHVGSVLTHNLR